MKKFLLTFIAVIAIQFAVAQYYYIPNVAAGKNPGGLNTDVVYPSGGGMAAGWSSIFTGNAATPVWSSTQTLPFGFSFNGAAVTQFKVSSSGILTFDVGTAVAAPTYTKGSLPSAAIPDKSVCIWGIAGMASNDYIVTKTFGSAPNRQFWVQFNSFGFGTTPSDGSNSTYWSIVLEETSNNIYIVDERTLGYSGANKVSAGVQINATTATSVAGSPNLSSTGNTDGTSVVDNSYYEFIQGVQPVNDITALKLTVANYLILGQAPFTISADLKNLGSSKALALDMNYQVNGGATVTAAASGVSINPFATQNVSSPTKWTPAATGTYSIKVWASNINGGADGNTANDAVTMNVIVVDNFAPRVIFNEVFTSSTCGPCVAGNINYKNVTDAKDQSKFTTVKYQMYYPGTGDPYYTAEAGTRHTFYGINSIPRMEVDGGWNVNAQSFTSALFDQFQAKPAFIELTGTSSFKFKTISITANIKPLTDMTSTSLYLFAAVCEKKTYNNVKTNGETEFDHVMKKLVPNANGTLLTGLTKNVTTTKNLSFTFPGVYTLAPSGAAPINVAVNHSIEEVSDLEVVLWIQDMNTKEVYQSGYTTHSLLGIDKQTSSVQNIQIVPNPTNGTTRVNFALNEDNNIQVSVVDAFGKTVRSFAKEDFTSGFNSFSFDVSDMATGVYFIKFNGDNFATTQKFIVR